MSRGTSKSLSRWLVKGHQVGKGALDLTRDLARSTRALCRVAGFRGCVVAFVSSIVTSNLVSTFLPHLVFEGESRYEPVAQRRATQQYRVACLGFGFQLCILGGSLGFGAYQGGERVIGFSPISRERLFLVISLESLQEVSRTLKRAFPLDISCGTESSSLVSRSLEESGPCSPC